MKFTKRDRLVLVFIFIILFSLNNEKDININTTNTPKQIEAVKVIEETEKIVLPKQEKTTKQEVPVNNESSGDYKTIVVEGGNLSGYREPMVKVDVGFGDREYWAYTNKYGQLFRVTAKKIILQDDKTEKVTSKGRYYYDEAKVPGTESPTLDEGHVIADSLGGVSNAYNITPQNSTVNRHGEQAYMEKVIRTAHGCENFEAIITYPNNTTQIPSKYKYTYEINGEKIVDEFNNENPED